MKVLFIDDEELIRKGLRMIVDWKSFGFNEMFEAETAEEAIRLIREQNPDFLLLDIRLPDMTGIDLCRIIRQEGYEGSIIIISGYSDFSYAQSAIRYNVVNYLLKPVKRAELSSTIKKALEERRKNTLVKLIQHDGGAAPRDYVIRSILEGKLSYSGALEAEWHFDFNNYYHLTSYRLLSSPLPEEETFRRNISLLPQTWLLPIEETVFILTFSARSQDKINEHLLQFLETAGSGRIFFVDGGSGSDPVKLSSLCVRHREIHDHAFFYANQDGICHLPDLPFRKEEFDFIHNTETTIIAVQTGDSSGLEACLKELQKGLILRSGTQDVSLNMITNYYCQILSELLNFCPVLQYDMPDKEHLLNVLSSFHYLYEYMEYLHSLLFHALSRIQDVNAQHPIRAVTGYIDTHLSEPLRIEAIADIFGYNRAYLGKLFRKETGKSFNTYLNDARIEYAKKLLLSDLPTNEIAARCGYSNYNYFSTIFKKQTGKSPSEYKSGQ